MKESIILTKSKTFSARIINMHRYLKNKKTPASLCDQILRSGTSICANVSEATFGFSKRDFLYKMSVALKECNETCNWIENLYHSYYLNDQEFESIMKDGIEIRKLLISIVKTTRDNLENDVEDEED